MFDILKIVSFLILIMVGLFMFAYSIDRAACEQKWEHSGFKSEYGLIKGCMIVLPDGKTIPAENYREIP